MVDERISFRAEMVVSPGGGCRTPEDCLVVRVWSDANSPNAATLYIWENCKFMKRLELMRSFWQEFLQFGKVAVSVEMDPWREMTPSQWHAAAAAIRAQAILSCAAPVPTTPEQEAMNPTQQEAAAAQKGPAPKKKVEPRRRSSSKAESELSATQRKLQTLEQELQKTKRELFAERVRARKAKTVPDQTQVDAKQQEIAKLRATNEALEKQVAALQEQGKELRKGGKDGSRSKARLSGSGKSSPRGVKRDSSVAESFKDCQIAYVTNIEGHWHYLCNYVEQSLALRFVKPGDPRQARGPLELELIDGWCFVFGGNAVGAAPGSLRVLGTLTALKEKYPARVILLMGDRDVHHMRIAAECTDAEAERLCEMPRAPWSSGPTAAEWLKMRGISKVTTTHAVQYLVGDEFEHRQRELQIMRDRQPSDDAVAQSFRDSVAPGGALLEFLSVAQLAFLGRGALFVQGQVVYNGGGGPAWVLGAVPQGAGTRDVGEWVTALNLWSSQQIAELRRQPVWHQSPSRPGGSWNARGGAGLIQYAGSPSSVLRARWLGRLQMPRRFPGDLVVHLRDCGVRYVVVGGAPHGNAPTVVRHHDVTLIMANTSQSHPGAHRWFPGDDRGDAVSDIVIDGLVCRVRGRTEAEQVIDYELGPDGDCFVGLMQGESSAEEEQCFVKAKLAALPSTPAATMASYLLSRYVENCEVEYAVMSSDDVARRFSLPGLPGREPAKFLAQSTFAKMDRDGDGRITRRDILAACAHWGTRQALALGFPGRGVDGIVSAVGLEGGSVSLATFVEAFGRADQHIKSSTTLGDLTRRAAEQEILGAGSFGTAQFSAPEVVPSASEGKVGHATSERSDIIVGSPIESPDSFSSRPPRDLEVDDLRTKLATMEQVVQEKTTMLQVLMQQVQTAQDQQEKMASILKENTSALRFVQELKSQPSAPGLVGPSRLSLPGSSKTTHEGTSPPPSRYAALREVKPRGSVPFRMSSPDRQVARASVLTLPPRKQEEKHQPVLVQDHADDKPGASGPPVRASASREQGVMRLESAPMLLTRNFGSPSTSAASADPGVVVQLSPRRELRGDAETVQRQASARVPQTARPAQAQPPGLHRQSCVSPSAPRLQDPRHIHQSQGVVPRVPVQSSQPVILQQQGIPIPGGSPVLQSRSIPMTPRTKLRNC